MTLYNARIGDTSMLVTAESDGAWKKHGWQEVVNPRGSGYQGYLPKYCECPKLAPLAA